METLAPRGDASLDVRAILRAALSNGHAPDLAALRSAPREELAQALAESPGNAVKEGSAARAFSHSTSIRTRWRINANSLKCSCSGRVFAA